MNTDKKILSGVDGELVILEDSRKDSGWKVLLVDEDLEIHQATKLILKDFKYLNKPLKFISASSGEEGKKLIEIHADTAVIVLDVVMLKLVTYIRQKLKNNLVRIILHADRPVKAPEEMVIINYDIDDVKTKTELTQQKLFVTMVAALRSYKNARELAKSKDKQEELELNLEQLVAERTRELKAANARLKHEIEQRQQTEIALRESKAKFKGIVDLAMSAIISINRPQRIILFNQGAERIFGYSAEEVLGKPLDLLLPIDFRSCHREYVDKFEEDFRETRKMGERSKQVFGRRKNGEEFPAEASISKLKLQSGTIFTVMLQDASDRVYAEEELRRTIEQQKAIAKQLENAKKAADSANRAKSEFLANMSHEIRTPLNAILGFSDLLSEAIAEPKAQAYIKSIASSGKALLAIVNDILDLSKIEAGKLELHYEPVNLRLLVEEIEKMFSHAATQKALSLLTAIGETVPVGINCDQVRLRQILFNLVGNAIKFTEKGYVKITVELLESSPPISENNPHCSLPNAVWLKMTVEDTGIGIPGKQQERIFGSFVQSEGQSNRKYGGSGLGLAITKRLTEMLGGAIALESKLGKGSSFTCYFPAVAVLNYSQEEAIAADGDEDLEQFPPLTVLVADDVQSNLELIEGYFAGSKHQLLLAKDGEEAIALARLVRPDIILMDLRMPNMDGKEAIKHLKRELTTKDIPIAIVSASAREVELQDISNFYSGFLLKPLTRSDVVAELKKIFPAMDRTPDVTTVPEEINPPNQAKLRQLLVKLRSYEAEVWPGLVETMKMRELREFAECLKQWGIECEYPSLLAYATAVETQVVEFDWDKLPNTVAAFPEVRRSLELLVANC